jgi:hypothetical protein
MTDGLFKQVDADIATIPTVTMAKGDSERDRIMKLLAHAYLRLWTRLALESGFRLRLSPMQFVLGTYEGQMRWHLNESIDFKRIAQLEMGGKFKQKHGLIAETYSLKGEDRVRLFISLEEEEVKNRPVLVNYLVYDEAMKAFDVKAAVDALKPVLPSWLETITSADDGPLWDYCKQKLECVGI